MYLVQVTVLSPDSSNPSLQLRERTVPVGTGKFLSAFMSVQACFKLVHSEIVTFNTVVH